MKTLYFLALASPAVAPALAAQAHESLRPFIAYLGAAKRAAREREERSRCRWEPVPVERQLHLEALDTIVEVVADGLAYRVEGFQGAPPPMPLFVGAQFRPVAPLRVDDGPTVWLSEAVNPAELVYWAGQRCTLHPAPQTFPERLYGRRADGSLAKVLHRLETPGALRVVVEGRAPVTLLSETGVELAHRILAANDGATKLRDAHAVHPWNGEATWRTPDLPEATTLEADNGVRFRWLEETTDRRRKRGVWIQLLPPDDLDGEATTDARAAYCDEGAREVRTQKGPDKRNVFTVLGARRDAYRLELDRLPPEGTTLFLPANLSGMSRQTEAIYRLKDSPLPHHRGLLALCEAPDKVRWPVARPAEVSRWFLLDDARYAGTAEQREFVQKALGTPDLAFLEGPPGSGKTHAICELVLQLIADGKRILLCSTTNVAVDNVLERLVGKFPEIEAVRIGRAERVDPKVRSCQLDERVGALTACWRERGTLSELDDEHLEAAAVSTVLASVNLTCGTTTGILRHPYIDRADAAAGSARWPHFDVVILDEASKTTFQEFLVPALLARRWIIVGDVRQLPPFTDPRDIEASIGEVSEERGQKFPASYQRACLLVFRLLRRGAGHGRVRWLIEEPREVLDALALELAARAERGEVVPEIVRLVERASAPVDLTLAEVERGAPSALRLLAATWVLVPRGELSRVARALPGDLLPLAGFAEASPADLRFRGWSRTAGALAPPVHDGKTKHHQAAELLAAQQTFLCEESWASEIAWRIGRVHQLATAANAGDRANRQAEVDALLPAAQPYATWVPPAIDAIRDVGVRSVIEALRVPRGDHRVRRRSALTDAIPEHVFQQRAVILTYQHRMHPDISALPRDLFYQGAALLDANTLDGRDDRVGWTFLRSAPARRVWRDVAGSEDRGLNRDEIEAMRRLLEQWKRTADAHPRRDCQPWEIACLSFYNRQQLGIRDMLRQLTGRAHGETRFALPNTQIVCATVDSFQGREADLVLLSLRNVRRPGHLDSPNRLNVAITRARMLLVIVGHRRYFAERCPSKELTALATRTPELPR